MTKSVHLEQFAPKRRPLVWLYGAGILILLLASWLWVAKVASDPERVFWGTLEQSLRTTGVSVSATRDENGSNVAYTAQYSLGGTSQARALTTITQPGATVVTETLGTTKADYTRYVDVKTDQKNTQGKPIDASKIEDVWTKSDGGSLLSQSVLGLTLPLGSMPVPIGNLPPEEREKLLGQMHNENVYEVSFDKVKKERKQGRMQYTYDVSIQMIVYAHLMKSFAKSVGLHELDQLDPNSYQGAAPIKAQITIDTRSRHIIAVSVPDISYKQQYSGYDVPVNVTVPTKTITSEELQKRLNELQ